MVDSATLEEIGRLKYGLKRRLDDSDSEASSIGERATNRGNKLKRTAKDVYEGKLGRSLHQTEQVEYAQRKRLIIHRHHVEYEGEDDPSEEDPYSDVRIEKILAPISHPSDILLHPSYHVTFSRVTLAQLCEQILNTITAEQRHLVALNRLLERLMGDDPVSLLQKIPILPPTDSAKLRREALLGDVNGVGADGEELEQGKRLTRQAASSQASGLLPLPINQDYDMGQTPQEAYDSKRILQAAVQRSEEYTRCLERVHHGLLKAKRLKQQVVGWCREAAGTDAEDDDQDDSDSNDK